jgi:hypothetical protein
LVWRRTVHGGETSFVKRVSAFRDYVGFFPWQPEAEAKWFETHGTFLFIVEGVVI